MLTIIDPETRADFDAFRALCWEYRDLLLALPPPYAQALGRYYTVEVYKALMNGLEAEHSPPKGGAKLVLQDGVPVGCGVFHRLFPDTAEIKRVYINDAARGTGAGRAIMLALIEQCRAQGFKRILMDTAVPLEAAKTLYLSLGFTLRGPYQEAPGGDESLFLFFEMTL